MLRVVTAGHKSPGQRAVRDDQPGRLLRVWQDIMLRAAGDDAVLHLVGEHPPAERRLRVLPPLEGARLLPHCLSEPELCLGVSLLRLGPGSLLADGFDVGGKWWDVGRRVR